jgi:glucose/mannose-6-phosphate isomerase
MNQKLVLPVLHSPRMIVLGGMGGSGAACDVVADWLAAHCDLPAIVVKDYHFPKYVDRRALVLIVSLSGNTKEMLSLLDEGIERGCDTVGVSSGGDLEKVCLRRRVPHNRVERVMVPRASVPTMVFVILRILDGLGLVDCDDELKEAVASMRKTFASVSPKVPFRTNRAKQVAKVLARKTAVVYTPTHMGSVGRHFKASMNENAKVAASAGSYPEILHNEIETWKAADGRAVVLARQHKGEGEVGRKLVKAKQILGRAGIPVFEVYGDGGTLSTLLDWCLFLDMVSIYVAVIRKVPPISTPLLDGLRRI